MAKKDHNAFHEFLRIINAKKHARIWVKKIRDRLGSRRRPLLNPEP